VAAKALKSSFDEVLAGAEDPPFPQAQARRPSTPVASAIKPVAKPPKPPTKKASSSDDDSSSSVSSVDIGSDEEAKATLKDLKKEREKSKKGLKQATMKDQLGEKPAFWAALGVKPGSLGPRPPAGSQSSSSSSSSSLLFSKTKKKVVFNVDKEEDGDESRPRPRDAKSESQFTLTNMSPPRR
jgi:hypothetical protein